MPDDRLQNILEWFNAWRHNGLMPLTMIRGYSDLLLKDQADLTGNQQRALEAIRWAAVRAGDLWVNPFVYLRTYLNDEAIPLRATSLKEVVEPFRTMMGSWIVIEVNLPTDLPLVASNDWWLSTALRCCLTHWHGQYAYQQGLAHTIKANVLETQEVLIQVQTRQRRGNTTPTLLAPVTDFPGSDLALADLIVQRHGSQLHVDASTLEANTQFTLSVWAEHGAT